jgi:pyruvate formate lyase activating enzyme
VFALNTGTIFDITRYSIHDGPGIRTTVFFKGCPLRCLWCHNPESQVPENEIFFWEDRCVGCGDCINSCNSGAINNAANCTLCGKCVEACCSGAREMVGRQITVSEVVKEIEKDLIFYDQSGGGVTFSGGEPLAQHTFLLDTLIACKEREIHTAVDTTGFCNTDNILQIGASTDLFLYDLKMMDSEKHEKYTGVSNKIILRNLRELSMNHNHIVIRFPLIPGINDDRQNIWETGQFIINLNIKKIHILPYHDTGKDKYKRLHKTYKLQKTKTPTPEKVKTVKETFMEFGLQVEIGG